MAPHKKLPTVAVDRATHADMQTYAEQYGLTLTDLVARMWHLWHGMDQARESGIFPSPLQDSLSDPLDTYLTEMEQQGDTLDEDYESPELTPAMQRNAAIADYQAIHPFIADGDDSPAPCPSCQRMTTKAGLVTIGHEVKCTACYTLPNLLQQHADAESEKQS